MFSFIATLTIHQCLAGNRDDWLRGKVVYYIFFQIKFVGVPGIILFLILLCDFLRR